MSEFGDRFFGVIVIVAFIVVVMLQHRTTVHVYDKQEEQAMSFIDCLFEHLPEGDFTNGQYDKAESYCRSR